MRCYWILCRPIAHGSTTKWNERASRYDWLVFLKQTFANAALAWGLFRHAWKIPENISKLSARNLIWDVLPAPFHYRTRSGSRVIWICNFMTTPRKLTYIHGRVMRFVPGEPLRAYSVGKLRNIRRRGKRARKVHRSVCRVHYAASSALRGKFWNSFLGEW